MAILLEGCDGAPVIWGKIGGMVIQRTKGGTMYIRKYVKPANPRTLAQQNNRLAFSAGILRWRTHEKLTHKEYWDSVAGKHGFRDGYRAFISSFMRCYQGKLAAFGNENLALSFVTDAQNLIEFLESPGRDSKLKKNNDLILRALQKRNETTFLSLIDSSIRYLTLKGWLDRIKFGLLPYVNETSEWEILRLGLLRDP